MTSRVPKDWGVHDTQDHAGFFVWPDECVHCGGCRREAPELFARRDAYPGDILSTVIRQPRTDEELRALMNAFIVCLTDCIYYGGKDAKIIEMMRKNEVAPHCIIHEHR